MPGAQLGHVGGHFLERCQPVEHVVRIQRLDGGQVVVAQGAYGGCSRSFSVGSLGSLYSKGQQGRDLVGVAGA